MRLDERTVVEILKTFDKLYLEAKLERRRIVHIGNSGERFNRRVTMISEGKVKSISYCAFISAHSPETLKKAKNTLLVLSRKFSVAKKG